MGSEFEGYTEWLVEEVRDFADWRTRDAESFPEDLRILQSSVALRALAGQISELPADHPKIQQLWRLWFGFALPNGRRGKTRALDLIRVVSDEIQQYGYDSADDGDLEPFLDSLARPIHVHRSSTDARRLVVWDRGVFFTATEPGLVERAGG